MLKGKKSAFIVRHFIEIFVNNHSLSQMTIISLALKHNVSRHKAKINSQRVNWLISCGFLWQSHTLQSRTCSFLACDAVWRSKNTSMEEQRGGRSPKPHSRKDWAKTTEGIWQHSRGFHTPCSCFSHCCSLVLCTRPHALPCYSSFNLLWVLLRGWKDIRQKRLMCWRSLGCLFSWM